MQSFQDGNHSARLKYDVMWNITSYTRIRVAKQLPPILDRNTLRMTAGSACIRENIDLTR